MDQNIIEVDDSEMKMAIFPDRLTSGRMGPCIAIAVYDPQTKSSYILHNSNFQSIDPDKIYLDEMIQNIQHDYGDLSRLRVFVTGNSFIPLGYTDEDQKQDEQSNRGFVEQVLGKYFSDSQIQIRWMSDNFCSKLDLDTSDGKFYLEIKPLEEVIDLSLLENI